MICIDDINVLFSSRHPDEILSFPYKDFFGMILKMLEKYSYISV